MHKFNRRAFNNFAQVFNDILCILIAFVLTVYFMYKTDYLQHLLENIWIPVLFSIMYVCIMYILDMYNLTTFTYQDRAIRNILISSICAVVLCLFMQMYIHSDDIRLIFFIVYLLLELLIVICQYIISFEVRKSSKRGWENKSIIVGDIDNIQEYIYFLKKTSFTSRIIGFVSLDGKEQVPDLQMITDLKSFHLVFSNYIVDEVIFAVHHSKIPEMQPYILICEERGLTVRLAIDFTELNRVKYYVHSIGTIPVVTYHSTVQNNLLKTGKRIFDVFMSIAITLLFIIVSIIIIPIMLLNKKNFKNIFCLEEYATLNGRSFRRIRFNADYSNFIGRFLIKTGVDCIPQAINVLQNCMSIVGTRPASIEVLKTFSNADFRRLSVKPGMTGVWKVQKREFANSLEEMTVVDAKYIDNWSMKKDLIIIIKTFFLGLSGKLDRYLF